MGQKYTDNGAQGKITVNGLTADGPTETQDTGNYSNIDLTPASPVDINSITVSSTTDIYVKSVKIFFEGEDEPMTLTLTANPQPGTYNVGTELTITASMDNALINISITKDGVSVVDTEGATSPYKYKFEAPGTYEVFAYGNAGDIYTEESFEGSYVIGDAPVPAVLSVDKASDTYTAPCTITVTSTKADDNIVISLKDQNDISIVNDTFTGSWTYTFTEAGMYSLNAKNNDGSVLEEYYEIVLPRAATPTFSVPSGSTLTVGQSVEIKSATTGAKISGYYNGDEMIINEKSPYTFNFSTAGTYSFEVWASAEGYKDSEIVNATYTVNEVVVPEVAPVITFSHEDATHHAEDAELEVEMTLNSDVYPVPEKIFYTLTGHKAHNTENPATVGGPDEASVIYEAAVNPATLTADIKVNISKSHADALGHRSVTINAYTSNTAGEDRAAATYFFDGTQDPGPDPEPSTLTATVVMANQGWSNGAVYSAGKKVNWVSETVDEIQSKLTFSPVGTTAGQNYAAYNGSKSPKGLRFYSTSTNNNTVTVTAPAGYAFVSAKITSTDKLKVEGTAYSSGETATFANNPTSIVFASAVTSTMALSAVEFVLTQTEVAAATAPSVIKTALADNTDDFNTMNGGSTSTKYGTYTSTDGWEATNSALFNGKSYSFIGDENTFAPTLTGKKSAKGTLTSPVLSNGIGTLSFNYGFPFSDTQAGMTITVKDENNAVLKTVTFKETGKTTKVKYDYSVDLNVEGKVILEFVNTALSNDGGNKDRISLFNMSWTNYGGSEPVVEQVATPTLNPTAAETEGEDITVAFACETEGVTFHYTVNGGEELTGASVTFSEVGTYVLQVWASKEGMTDSKVATGNYTINAKPVVVEPVEELFLVMDRNVWDSYGREVAVPFSYKGEGIYELAIEDIPADGWHWWPNLGHGEDIHGGFQGNFYVRDGKANHKGLVFAATGASVQTYAVDPEAQTTTEAYPNVEYNMEVVNGVPAHQFVTAVEGRDSEGNVTTDGIYKKGIVQVKYTPGAGAASAKKTLKILADENGAVSAVENIAVDNDANAGEAVYYNLQGVRVPADGLTPGLYIRRQGRTAEKVLVK